MRTQHTADQLNQQINQAPSAAYPAAAAEPETKQATISGLVSLAAPQRDKASDKSGFVSPELP